MELLFFELTRILRRPISAIPLDYYVYVGLIRHEKNVNNSVEQAMDNL